VRSGGGESQPRGALGFKASWHSPAMMQAVQAAVRQAGISGALSSAAGCAKDGLVKASHDNSKLFVGDAARMG
jgi:hypothetical protein